MASYGLFLLAPLMIGLPFVQGRSSSQGFESDVSRKNSRTDDIFYATAPPPAVTISIEPTLSSPFRGAESPVVFPGYLLPDDGCEEPAHAGS